MGRPACTGPITYTGHAALQADIDNLKKALAATGAEEGFMCSIGPGSFARGVDLYYKTEEEFLFASADAMREEYKAITEAGFIVQVDEPEFATTWFMFYPDWSVEEYRKHLDFPASRSDQSRAARPAGGADPLSHVLGLRATARMCIDIEFQHIADKLLKIDAQA